MTAFGKPRDYWESIYPSDKGNVQRTREFVSHQRKQRLALLKMCVSSKTGIKILETGCGAGDDLSNITKNDILCVGLDYSKNAIKSAKTNHPSLDFVLGDICSLPFGNNNFDVVFNAGVVEHYINPLGPLKEMNRVSKRQGFVVVFVPNTFSLWTLYRHITNMLPKISKKFHGWGVWEQSFSWYGLKRIGETSGMGNIEVKGITLLHCAYFISQCEQAIKRNVLPMPIKSGLVSLFSKLDARDSGLSKWFGMELVLIGRSTQAS
jgi:ubiquinone/menaquinone biosynthesis C-methylase UbiE